METLKERKQCILLVSEIVRRWKLSTKWMKVIFFKLFKIILRKVALENMKITPKIIILFLLHMYVFASEILTLTTQFENCKSSTWIPELWNINEPSLSLSHSPSPSVPTFSLPLQKIVLISTHYLLYFCVCWVILIPLNKICCLLQLDMTVNSKKVAKDKVCIKHI